MPKRKHHSQEIAAANAGISVRSARCIERDAKASPRVAGWGPGGITEGGFYATSIERALDLTRPFFGVGEAFESLGLGRKTLAAALRLMGDFTGSGYAL